MHLILLMRLEKSKWEKLQFLQISKSLWIFSWLLFGGARTGAAKQVVVYFGLLDMFLGVGNQGLLHVAHDLARDQEGRQQLSK